mmetsp:Transcript_23344/g.51074  ORF Transcript_23344/g.51074 Transcript_23344/m.51074 type:complete len:84 (-) Transcript_23344:194-445(-)
MPTTTTKIAWSFVVVVVAGNGIPGEFCGVVFIVSAATTTTTLKKREEGSYNVLLFGTRMNQSINQSYRVLVGVVWTSSTMKYS